MKDKHAAKLASALLARPTAAHYGWDLRKSSGLRSGVLYPLLTQFVAQGWLQDGWEPEDAKRDRRRYYLVTTEGRRALSDLVDA